MRNILTFRLYLTNEMKNIQVIISLVITWKHTKYICQFVSFNVHQRWINIRARKEKSSRENSNEQIFGTRYFRVIYNRNVTICSCAFVLKLKRIIMSFVLCLLMIYDGLMKDHTKSFWSYKILISLRHSR